MQQQTFNLQESCGVYFLCDGNQKVVTPNGSELWTKSEELAELMLAEAVEAGLRWDDWRTIICFQSRYCDYAADQERLNRDTEMLEETLYGDNFWGFNEPMKNRAAVVSAYKQTLLGTIQNMPLNDRVIFLTTAEMLNTILLPHKIISTFFFETFNSFRPFSIASFVVLPSNTYVLSSMLLTFLSFLKVITSKLSLHLYYLHLLKFYLKQFFQLYLKHY